MCYKVYIRIEIVDNKYKHKYNIKINKHLYLNSFWKKLQFDLSIIKIVILKIL